MSLVTWGLGHLTTITMGLGNSFGIYSQGVIPPMPEITFVDKPAGIEMEYLTSPVEYEDTNIEYEDS